MRAGRNSKDAKAAFLIEERDPFNQAGEALGGGASFWGGGVHLDGIILTDIDNAKFPPSYICCCHEQP
jgi:hypothetical protein